VFFSDGSSETPKKKRFTKKIVSKSFYKKFDQKSKTDFFSIFLLSRFWAFLAVAMVLRIVHGNSRSRRGEDDECHFEPDGHELYELEEGEDQVQDVPRFRMSSKSNALGASPVVCVRIHTEGKIKGPRGGKKSDVSE
jgi:hypothetical protein